MAARSKQNNSDQRTKKRRRTSVTVLTSTTPFLLSIAIRICLQSAQISDDATNMAMAPDGWGSSPSRPLTRTSATTATSKYTAAAAATAPNLGQSSCLLSNYSFRSQDFARYHPNDCQTMTQFLDAIKFGTRQWNSNGTWTIGNDDKDATDTEVELEKEKHYSTFRPYRCEIPILSQEEVCRLSNQFSHILNLGDSLNRNLQYGFLMNWRANVYNGSHLPPSLRRNDVNNNSNTTTTDIRNCTCDAQFVKQCRPYSVSEWGQTLAAKQLRVCPGNDDFVTTFAPQTPYEGNPLYTFEEEPLHDNDEENKKNNNNSNNNNNIPLSCTSPDFKGLLIVANGGLHLRSKPDRVFNKFLVGWLNQPALRECAAAGRVYFIWNSFHAHSPSIDSVYPFQSRAHGQRFNTRMNQFLTQHPGMVFSKPNNGSADSEAISGSNTNNNNHSIHNNPYYHINAMNMVTIDWFALSRGAQTHDGIHFVTDVNYRKAQHVLQVAARMKAEHKQLRFTSASMIEPLQPAFLCPIWEEELDDNDEEEGDKAKKDSILDKNDGVEQDHSTVFPWVTNLLSRKRYNRYRMKCHKLAKWEIGFRHKWNLTGVLEELKGRTLQ